MLCLRWFILFAIGSATPAVSEPLPQGAPSSSRPEGQIEHSTPEAQGIRSEGLIKLTKWVRDSPMPIFSILISRNNKLVYELYTSSIDPDAAHYLMSATKSVLSALIGVAVDRQLIPGPEAKIRDLLPRRLFRSHADYDRFEPVTLKQAMGMAGLDDPDPPRKTDAASLARWREFWAAPNRVASSLTRPILKDAFQYNDSTPELAVGALQYATKKSAFAFGEEALFGPLGFRNAEWMHQDASGIDNGGYGLRLRPIDMQKFGLLYLDHGLWNGKQLLSKEWVERSFQPWNRSNPKSAAPDYGWFWWAADYGPGWSAHVAKGWKGQRIAVFPDQQLVVTMTACIEDGTEQEFFDQLVTKVLIPSVQSGPKDAGASESKELRELLDQVHRGPARFSDWIEYRMVPSVAPKQTHRPFVQADSP